jgi:NADPH:quinone reductase-like Zn-dependent oxidoreductase
VAALGEVDVWEPGEGEVLLRIDCAPVNPADVNVLEGKYGSLPMLPCVPGVEGVATVALSRSACIGEGQRVLVPAGLGSWRCWATCGAQKLVRVDPGVPLEQAAMLRINPATADCMLREFVALGRGDVIVQNAANSGVGRSVIQIARVMGLKTVNVVRRPELIDELVAIGADHVILEGEQLSSRIRERAGGHSLKLGLNAVGGESALGIAGALADGGTLVTYGAMGRQPIRVPNGFLIFKNIHFCGFWVSRWYGTAEPEAVSQMFKRLMAMAVDGTLHTPVAGRYPLSQIRAAIEHAQAPMRTGKVLLHPGEAPSQDVKQAGNK